MAGGRPRAHTCTPSNVRAVSYLDLATWVSFLARHAFAKMVPSCCVCVAMSSRGATLRRSEDVSTLLPPPLFYHRFREVNSPNSVAHTARIHMIHFLSVAIARCRYPADHNFSSLWEDSKRLLNIQYPSAHVGLIEWLAEVICFRNLINPFWPSRE